MAAWRTGTRDYNPDAMAARQSARILKGYLMVVEGTDDTAVLARIADIADSLEVLGSVSVPKRESAFPWFTRLTRFAVRGY